MTAARDPREFPRLRHVTRMGPPGRRSLLVAGNEFAAVDERVGGLDVYAKVSDWMDGRRSVLEIAERAGVPVDTVCELVELLSAAGLLAQEDVRQTIPVDEFLARVQRTVRLWASADANHELFDRLRHENASARLVVGLVLETYHLVAAAPRHIATAVAACPNDSTRQLLSTYFASEYDHRALFTASLAGIGISGDAVALARPLIATTSLIDVLCETARHDALAYIACLQLAELNGSEPGAAAELAAMFSSVGLDPAAARPLGLHCQLDADADHTNLLGEALADVDTISASQADLVVLRLYDFSRVVAQWRDGILAYYSDPRLPVPPRRFEYRDL